MKSCGLFFLIVVAVVAGLGLGLLVGWVLWPVEWINAAPENMRVEYQSDWLNMAIDSYSVNQNDELAIQRFSYLGETGPALLAQTVADPVWVSEADAMAYAETIKQGESQVVVEQTVDESLSSLANRLFRPPLFGYVAVAFFLALLAIVLLVILVFRLLGGKKSETEVAPEAVPVAAVVAEGSETLAEETPVLVAAEAEEAATDVAEEGESGLGVGAVAVGAAAVAGAVLAGSDDKVEEEPGEIPAEAVEAAEIVVDEPVEEAIETAEVPLPDEDSNRLGAVAAAGVAAAGIGWALESETDEGEEAQPGALDETLVAAGVVAGMAEGEVPEPALEEPTDEWLPEEPEGESSEEINYGKYNRKIIDIEGIGSAYAERLSQVGVTSTHALLQQCATPKGRQELAEKTNISGKLILEWANHADMMRIQGIGPQWSDLLQMVGVNTVREMALRNPVNLHESLVAVNDEKKLVRQLPTLVLVEDWVEQAKDLPRILTY